MLVDEPLWTVEDVALYLRVSEMTVRAWQQDRRLPFVKIGGTVRFVPAEIRQLVLEAKESRRARGMAYPM